MLFLLSITVTVYCFYATFARARRDGSWSWPRLLYLLAAIAVFFFGFMLPIINSTWLATRPALFLSLLLGGIFLFVTAIALVTRANSGGSR